MITADRGKTDCDFSIMHSLETAGGWLNQCVACAFLGLRIRPYCVQSRTVARWPYVFIMKRYTVVLVNMLALAVLMIPDLTHVCV